MRDSKADFYLIEAFNKIEKGLKGNIAAVVILPFEISDRAMQNIAIDFNQPATSFLIPKNNGEFNVRWYAPIREIELCGHGALAAIASLTNQDNTKELILNYPTGQIKGFRKNDSIASIDISGIEIIDKIGDNTFLEEAFGAKILEHYTTYNKNIVVFQNENTIRHLKPDFEKLRQLDYFGYSVTAKGEHCDFVSRTIIPFVPILEDQATGSSHAALVPYWSKILNKNNLEAYQLSPRGGKFICNYQNGWVNLEGQYSIFANGQMPIRN